LELLFDGSEYAEFDSELKSTDPLNFEDRKSYKERLEGAVQSTGVDEAVVNAEGSVRGHPIVCSCMEYGFIGGSMGSVVGEKITRAVERALQTRKPLLIILARLHKEGIPYISLLTDPTTGGVTASFAMLGDLNIAEPRALIGFAGPRVIEQTIRQKLPDGFQRSEFLLDHGMLDAVVERKDIREFLGSWLTFMVPESPADSGA
jgi:acetyl-CoA carboxylase carboxyl transferase subunit beta